MRALILALLFVSNLYLRALSFSFTTSDDPTECGSFTLEWNGGTAPFYVLVTPVFGTPRNLTVPSTAFSNGKGSFTTQINMPNKKQFLVTMSDSTGFGSGGSTPVFTVGPSTGAKCDTTEATVAFSYQLNGALQQCRPYTFEAFVGAIQPVKIIGIVPGGTSFALNPPNGPTSFTWSAVNAQSRTSLIFVMIDSRGRQGGSSDLVTVGASDDSTCINGSSPSSTASPSSTTTTHTSTAPTRTPKSSATKTGSSPPSATTTEEAKSTTPFGAIVGSVLGSLIFLAVCITLGLFFLRKRRDQKTQWDPRRSTFHSGRAPGEMIDGDRPQSPYHYASNPPAPTPQSPYHYSNNPPSSAYPFLNPGDQHTNANPFLSPAPSHSNLSLNRSNSNPFDNPPPGSTTQFTEVDPFTSQSSHMPAMTSAQRKAAMAGVSPYTKPSRFVLHTDLEDTIPEPEPEDIVELPPQYSERRGPKTDVPSATAPPPAVRAPPPAADAHRGPDPSSPSRPRSTYDADPYGGLA